MIDAFLIAYTRLLVDHPEDISVEITGIDEGLDEITIFANSEDVGKLIGRQGRMINSIKTVISGCKAKYGKNYRLNVKPIA
ncbi:KH domain-containing protein [Sulfurovum sp.]|jgi:predicted RNA-binding protein YlqC (UPF0109 family)|uniref:KH domain-containing protein n=1 Tax=Sulfurovum sp. TaxID=1969726 RepID=UPI002A36EC14|nr:KH domain-containing protein [Sulfurovum sp.]MDD2451510.1 KH domain-containing protein [Sulfurovum sp.]MDD3499537.1 KH domain-containing protein [Sulfurovum sp.]MDY0403083.1 KH domain-containing protein [Sulfurovum sp.]